MISGGILMMSAEGLLTMRRSIRRTKTPARAFAAVFIMSIAFVSAPGSVKADEGLHSLTNARPVKNVKNCSGGHAAVRKYLKEQARNHCRGQHNTRKKNILHQEKYYKVSCDKEKEGKKVVRIHTKGTLTFLCN